MIGAFQLFNPFALRGQPFGKTLAQQIRALFANNEKGVWYDPSDLTSMFQDSAGTTAAVVGQPVGLVLDKSKGLVLGSELVTNGGFDSGAGWTLGAGYSITGGQLVVATGGYSEAYSSISTISGKSYRVEFDLVSYSSGVPSVTLSGGTAITVSTATGRKSFVCVAGASTSRVTFIFGAAGCVIDNISVKELPGNHATQPTSTARPILARHPITGRRNLLTYTEDFSNAAWSKTNTTVTANAAIAPDGSTTADLVVLGTLADDRIGYQAIAVTLGSSYELSFYARSVFGTTTWEYRVWTGASYSASQSVVLSTEWQRVAFQFIADATDSCFIVIGANISAAGSTVSAYLWGAQLELGSTPTAYQKVTSTYDVTEAGVNDAYYLRFDGVDDFMVTPTVDFSATDKMSVFAGLRTNEIASAAAVGCELSADPATNNGTFTLAPHADASFEYAQFSSDGTARATAKVLSGSLANVAYVYTGIGWISTDTCVLRRNGVEVIASATDQGTGNFGNYPLYIGMRAGTSLPLNGPLYSLVVRGALSDAAQIAAAEAYVNSKTGAY